MDEQEEEKTGNIKERSTHEIDRSQAGHIPLDLILEILSRLPAKSIVRYRAVSKLWSSITTTPDFINSFEARSSTRPPSLLLTFLTKEKRFVFIIPQNQNPDGSCSPVDSYQMTNTSNWNTPLSECVQGLVLLPKFVIWNPTMRQVLTLPDPTERRCGGITSWCGGMTYLGYDPLENKHKVLRVYNARSEQPVVFTLGAQESWKIITQGIPRHLPNGSKGRCFNGILYYEAHLDSHGHHDCIMSFDVRSEKFNPITLPGGYSLLRPRILLYDGRLALVSPRICADDKIDLCILKDADGHEWTHKHVLVPSNRDKIRGRICLEFRGVTDAGELIFASERISESMYILYFDPRRNCIREALFEGIAGDEEFIRRYGYLDFFLNKIESRISV